MFIGSFKRAPLLLQVRRISTLEAKRIMQIPDASTPSQAMMFMNEEYLKKQYLKLAKVYHPDAQGSSVSLP
jgi:hypothetical protein